MNTENTNQEQQPTQDDTVKQTAVQVPQAVSKEADFAEKVQALADHANKQRSTGHWQEWRDHLMALLHKVRQHV